MNERSKQDYVRFLTDTYRLSHDLDEAYVRLAAGILFRPIAEYPESWQAEQLELLTNAYQEVRDELSLTTKRS